MQSRQKFPTRLEKQKPPEGKSLYTLRTRGKASPAQFARPMTLIKGPRRERDVNYRVAAPAGRPGLFKPEMDARREEEEEWEE